MRQGPKTVLLELTQQVFHRRCLIEGDLILVSSYSNLRLTDGPDYGGPVER